MGDRERTAEGGHADSGRCRTSDKKELITQVGSIIRMKGIDRQRGDKSRQEDKDRGQRTEDRGRRKTHNMSKTLELTHH